jgi:hypothetical protein
MRQPREGEMNHMTAGLLRVPTAAAVREVVVAVAAAVAAAVAVAVAVAVAATGVPWEKVLTGGNSFYQKTTS